MLTNRTKNSEGDNSKSDNSGEINYSLGILIILLMIFWFMCKGIGNTGYSTCNRDLSNNMMSSNSMYPARFNAFSGGLTQPRRGSIVTAPSSKTSERKFYDKSDNSSDSEDNGDEKQVLMHLYKQQDYYMGPKSKTDSHVLMCNNEHKRTS